MTQRAAPISCSVTISGEPELLFDLFVAGVGSWWPFAKVAPAPDGEIVIERGPNGRWYQRTSSAEEILWATIVACIPPRALIMNWNLDERFAQREGVATELEIYFHDNQDGTTRISVIHAGLERLPGNPTVKEQKINAGWREVLQSFQDFIRKARWLRRMVEK